MFSEAKLIAAACVLFFLNAASASGETLRLECSDLMDRGISDPFVFEFTTDDWSGYMSGGAAPRWLKLLSESDDHLLWIYENEDWPGDANHLIAVYLLNRRTLIMTINAIALDNYEMWRDFQSNLGSSAYMQCVRPL
ncbi:MULTISPECIES: hypothetical protein [unclassified Roseobacter]|uniref:hypothetical protein n=1 Tax=unclassified Roseobacter TaxID=196798 RepID=UPI0030EB9F9C